MDGLAVLTMCARILQTSVHMVLRESVGMIGMRFSLFLIQVIAMFAMGLLVVVRAAG
jgi:hypothetical protein